MHVKMSATPKPMSAKNIFKRLQESLGTLGKFMPGDITSGKVCVRHKIFR